MFQVGLFSSNVGNFIETEDVDMKCLLFCRNFHHKTIISHRSTIQFRFTMDSFNETVCADEEHKKIISGKLIQSPLHSQSFYWQVVANISLSNTELQSEAGDE